MKSLRTISPWLLIVAIVTVLSLPSCGNAKPDDSTTTFQPSSQNKQYWAPVKDSTGKIVAVEKKDSIVAVITPTWGQAFHYANKSKGGNWVGLILGTLSFATFCLLIFMMTRVNGPSQKVGIGLVLVAALSGALYGWFGKASTIKSNNKKEVAIEVYQATVKDGNDSRVIWNSLFEENKLIGASSK